MFLSNFEECYLLNHVIYGNYRFILRLTGWVGSKMNIKL